MDDIEAERNELRAALADTYAATQPTPQLAPGELLAVTFDTDDLPGIVADIVASRDRLRTAATAAAELVDARIEGWAEQEERAWIAVSDALAKLTDDDMGWETNDG